MSFGEYLELVVLLNIKIKTTLHLNNFQLHYTQNSDRFGICI